MRAFAESAVGSFLSVLEVSGEDPLRLLFFSSGRRDLDLDLEWERLSPLRRSRGAGERDELREETDLRLLWSLLGVRERDESLREMDLARSP